MQRIDSTDGVREDTTREVDELPGETGQYKTHRGGRDPLAMLLLEKKAAIRSSFGDFKRMSRMPTSVCFLPL